MSLEQVLKQIRRDKFWRDPKVKICLLANLIINIINWAYLYFHMRSSSPAVPLSYNILVGVASIGHWTKLLVIPFCGLMILLINSFLLYKVYQKENHFLVYLLLTCTSLFQVLLLMAAILITNL